MGHDAWSCDLLESETPGNHIQGDVLEHLSGWDLMIAHPPCTYLCNSVVRWMFGGNGKVRDEKRWKLMEQAAVFFYRLMLAPVNKFCIEILIMHRYAIEHIARLNKSSTREVKQSQTI